MVILNTQHASVQLRKELILCAITCQEVLRSVKINMHSVSGSICQSRVSERMNKHVNLVIVQTLKRSLMTLKSLMMVRMHI